MQSDNTNAQKEDELRQRNQRREEEKIKREELRKQGLELKEKAERAIKKRQELSLWGKYGHYSGYVILGALFLFILISNFAGDRRRLTDIQVNEETFITTHNEGDATFKLGKNDYFEGKSLAQLKELFDNRVTTKKTMPRCNTKALDTVSLKDSYNFYEEHPECHFDEKSRWCSSGYVEAPLSVYRNRNCLKQKGEDFKPSVDFMFRCNTKNSNGCKGGYMVQTLMFMRKGIVSEECWTEKVGEEKKDEESEKTCPVEKLKDCEKRFVGTHCALEGEEEVKKEIQSNGPVMSIMAPFRDYFVYKSGDYIVEEKSKLDGTMIIKIVGWETLKDGTGVWLVDPLWGKNFGTNGLSRIRIGAEDSFIEKFAYTFYTEKADEKEENEKRAREGQKVDDTSVQGGEQEQTASE